MRKANNFAVHTVELKLCGSTLGVMPTKDADGMANSGDAEQTAVSSGSTLFA